MRKISSAQLLGGVLRGGVVMAALLVAAGGIAAFFTHRSVGNTLSSFTGASTPPLEVIRLAVHLEPMALIQAGLLVLILTPALRVASSLVSFLRERDWVFSAVTLIVLAVLMAGLFA